MRIAIAAEIFLPKEDGVTLDLANLLKLLKAHGHSVLIIGPGYSIEEFMAVASCAALDFQSACTPGLRCSFVTPGVFAKLARFNPDVVYVIDPFWIGLQVLCFAHVYLPSAATILGYSTNIPHYTAAFGFPQHVPFEWGDPAAPACDSDIDNLPIQLDNEQALRLGWDQSKIHVWLGGVDSTLFNPAKRDKKLRESWLRYRRSCGQDHPLVCWSHLMGEESAGALGCIQGPGFITLSPCHSGGWPREGRVRGLS